MTAFESAGLFLAGALIGAGVTLVIVGWWTRGR